MARTARFLFDMVSPAVISLHRVAALALFLVIPPLAPLSVTHISATYRSADGNARDGCKDPHRDSGNLSGAES